MGVVVQSLLLDVIVPVGDALEIAAPLPDQQRQIDAVGHGVRHRAGVRTGLAQAPTICRGPEPDRLAVAGRVEAGRASQQEQTHQVLVAEGHTGQAIAGIGIKGDDKVGRRVAKEGLDVGQGERLARLGAVKRHSHREAGVDLFPESSAIDRIFDHVARLELAQ